MADRDRLRLQYLYALQDRQKILEEVALDGSKASDVLTLVANATNGKIVTIDSKVYTFKTALDAADGTVKIGVSAADSIDNLMRAITLGTGAGVVYGDGTIQHATVTAADGAGSTLVVTAKAAGTVGNAISVSTDVTGASWATPTLTGGSALSDDVREKALDQAIQEYSRRFFRIETVLVSSAANGYYATPTDWLPGLSRIVSIESPVDQSPPSYIGPKSWRVVRRESSQVIYISPNPGPTFRLTFTAKHDEAVPATIPVEHEGSLGKWAAMIACQSFAAKYGNTVQNNVDSVNYRTKQQEWTDIYKLLRAQLDKELGAHEIALQTDAEPMTYYRGWDV